MKVISFFQLLLISIALALASCSPAKREGGNGDAGDPVSFLGCSGFVTVSIREKTPPPKNLRVEWNGETLLDECSSISKLFIERDTSPNQLVLGHGGRGFTAPQRLSLKAFDQGACLGNETLYFSAVDRPISSSPNLCESFELIFEP